MKLTPLEARVAGALYDQRFGCPMTCADIAAVVWADDYSGGPDDAANTVRKTICAMQRKLAPIGCVVVNEHGRGYRLIRGTVACVEVAA